MKTKTAIRIALISLGLCLSTQAQNGTWTNGVDAPDSFWSATSNWLNGVVADGAGNAATFSNELAAAVTVNLDSARTVGDLIFAQGTYSITNNGVDAVNILTLEGLTKPVVFVPSTLTATLQRTVLAGTNGFILDGGGTFTFFKQTGHPANTISGDVILTNNSTLDAREGNTDFNVNDLAYDSLGSITFYGDAPGSTFNLLSDVSTSPSYGTVNNDLIVPAGQVGTINLSPRWNGASGDNSAGIGTGLGGTLTGAGTLIVTTRYIRGNVVGDWSTFTGQINITPGSTATTDQDFRPGHPAGYPNSSVDLGGSSYFTFHYYRQLTSNTVFRIGKLTGANAEVFLRGSDSAAFTLSYDVGAKQTSPTDTATFAGNIVNGNGPAGLIKNGAGTLILTGSNTFSGGTIISNGVLQVGDGTSDGGLLGTGPVVNHRALVITQSGSITIPGAISGAGSITNSGNASTVILSGANSYTGPTVVSAGNKLVFGTASSLPGGCIIGGGGGLGARVMAAGTSVSLGSIALGAGCSFDFDLSVLGNPTATIVTDTGALALNGDVTVNVAGASLALSAGTFTLLEYGSRSGSGNFVQGTLPNNVTGTILDDVANKRVTLTISAVFNPTLQWVGSAAGDWDINNAANQIWRVIGSGAITNYRDGVPVRFDDTATGNTSVNNTTAVAPDGVTVDNSTLTYTFGGIGGITGRTKLTKRGSGKLTVLTPNDYAGGTDIQAGTVQIGDGVALGGALGTGPITNNGTLVVTSAVPVAISSVISGSGAVEQKGSAELLLAGVNTHSGGVEIGPSSVLTLQGPGTPGGAGATVRINDGTLSIVNINVPGGNPVIISNSAVIASSGGNRQVDSPISGTNVTLVFSNSTLLTLNGSIAGVSGTIVLGTPAPQLLRFNSGGANNCFGSPSAHFVIPAGASLQNRNGGTIDLGGIEGAGLLGGPQNANNATVNFSIGALNTSTEFTGTIDNGDLTASRNRLTGITKVGTGTLTLSNATLPYFGPTVVNNGILALGGSGWPTNSATITVAAPGVLNVAGLDVGALRVGFSPANSNGVQVLSGNGTVQGNVVLGPAGRLEPGITVGTLNVSGSVTLDGTTVMQLEGGSATSDRLAAPTITYGGTLILTNVGAVTGTKTYQLFSATTLHPGFASVVTQTLAGVTWDLSQLNVNGSISVTGPAGPPRTPTNIVFSLTGDQLSLEWPPSHTGWELQTNAASITDSASWFAVPDSAATNRVIMTVDPTRANVYYRLHLQFTP